MTEIADESSREGRTGDYPVRVFRREEAPEDTRQELLREQTLQVFVNGVLTMRLVCTRSDLPELVMGRLLTEGLIREAEDVASVTICRFGRNALVTLRENAGAAGREPESGTDSRKDSGEAEAVPVTPSCCTGNQILDASQIREKALHPVQEREIHRAWIFRLADAFAREQPLYAATHSVHSCILSCSGEILFSCEDIGRHNAMDKAIGYAMLHGISLPDCEVYTSGRIPVDMTEKAIRAGIPVLVSKALPTREAVDLAASCGMMVIGQARPDSFHLFCGGENLV